MSWSVELWGSAVEREIEDLPRDIRARLEKFRVEIELFGPMSLPAKHAKYLGEGLWELRLSGRDGIARIIYITVMDRRVLLLRAFVKKTQKTPLREIQIARQRAKALML